MVLKFSQQMKHAQRIEKYIRLIFNSYISDDDFFQNSMCIIDTNVHYATLNTVHVHIQSNLSSLTFQGNSEIWSHKTGGCLIQV
jgi:hypothetical protein